MPRKLTEAQREEIRNSTDPLNIFLADKYGVATHTIYVIRNPRRTILPPKGNEVQTRQVTKPREEVESRVH
jgi:hypothetical protein